MRAFWRSDTALGSHAEWRARLGKNSKQGTSAPTLAAVWAGPVELMGALHQQRALQGVRLTIIAAEAQSKVDDFSGPRNHDLVVRGELPNGERVIVCIEAKAGEDFGATIKQQRHAARRAQVKADQEGKKSNATARLDGLLERFVAHPRTEERVQTMRYQLLTALAGTLHEAEKQAATHAVMMVHDFLTDVRSSRSLLLEHDRDLRNFVTTVFDREPPSVQEAPWCIDVSGRSWAPHRRLYLARAVTDLRTATLESRTAAPTD